MEGGYREEWTKGESKPFATRLRVAFENYQQVLAEGILYDGIFTEYYDLK